MIYLSREFLRKAIDMLTKNRDFIKAISISLLLAGLIVSFKLLSTVI